MIKLKSILKENHILITEKFAAGKLRALTNHWQGLEAQFFMWGAKLGVEWDKIKDSEIETNTKPKKKGIEIAYVDKEVTVPTKGKKGYWSSDNFRLKKFTAVLVLKDGKPVWWTHDYEPVTRVQAVTGKRVVGSGSTVGRVATVDAGPRDLPYPRRDKTFGMNQLGYQSLSSVMKIPGIKFHHINLDEDQPYMGAGVKRQMRQAAQFGASKFATNDEFKRINQSYFDELLRKRINDPKKLAEKVKKAANFCQQIIDAALGGVKATGKVKKIVDSFQSNRTVATQESDAYALASAVGDDLSQLYRYYGYYLGALEAEKQDKIKYGTADFSRSEVEGYAKDVQRYTLQIMSGRFR
jgi:hypothetical protein